MRSLAWDMLLVSELPTASQGRAPDRGGPTPDHTLEPSAATTPLPAEGGHSFHCHQGKTSGEAFLAAPPGCSLDWRSWSSQEASWAASTCSAHFSILGTRNVATTAVVRGGTWTDDTLDPDSLIPNGGSDGGSMDQALYLPLFYGDAQGVVHPGAAREIPSVQNGGISADATTWTFRLRPHLVWSDGAPYDARDVDYTWQLWLNSKFGAVLSYGGTALILRAYVSADHLSISFHLTHAYAAFFSTG